MGPAIPQQTHPIRPTLFLGLGGTGKEVLLRLRRKFYERFRTTGLPCTSYLWIDTDTRDVGARGEKLDEAFAAVGFQETERIPLLTGKVSDNLGDIFTNPERWGYIHDWLYEEVERYGQEISDGAGGVRAIGRLTLFGSMTNLTNRIGNELDKLMQRNSILDTQEFYRTHGLGVAKPDEAGPVVIVVCSLAGGTGCGTFLDAGFLLRYLNKIGKRVHQSFAFCFLPNVYYNSGKSEELGERSYANAYAALKELDFYSLRLANAHQPSIDFQVEWEKGHQLKVQGPPFSAVYLLEMRNEGGISVSQQHRGDLFAMLAESFFLDMLPGQFSTGKRSDYANITQQLAGAAGANSSSGGIVLPQTFSRRYASCGLSKIEIPIDAIRGASAAQLAGEILESFVRENEDPSMKSDVRTDLALHKIDREGIAGRYSESGEWKENIRREAAMALAAKPISGEGHVVELEESLRKMEDRLIRSDSADKTRIGDTVQTLRAKTPGVIEQSKKSAIEILRNCCLENEGRLLAATIRDGGYLDQAIAYTRGLYDPLEQGIKSEFDFAREQCESEANAWKARRDFQLVEFRSALRSLTVKMLGASEFTIGKLRERLREAQEQYLLARAEMFLLEEAKKVARAVVDTLREKKKALVGFRDSVEAMRTRLKTRHDQFLEVTTHVLFVRLFSKQSDWPIFYVLDRNEENGEMLPVAARAEYRRMLQAKFGANSGVLEMADVMQAENAGEVERRITQYCEKRFEEDFAANPRKVNVLEHPQMKERKDEILSNLVSAARPMLQHAGSTNPNRIQVPRVAYLGIANPQVEPYRSVVQEIEKKIKSISDYNYRLDVHPTDNPSEIYLYMSNYAFSLPDLRLVSHDCHEAYVDFYQKLNDDQHGTAAAQIPLHLNKKWEGKFDELVIYTDQEARTLKEVYSVLTFGSLLKVVTLKSVRGTIQYQYRFGPPHNRFQPLGTRRNTISILRRDDTTRGMLLNVIRNREATLTVEQATSYYWGLQAQISNPETLPGTPEHTLLTAKLDEIHAKLDAMKVDMAALDTKNIPEEERYEYIKKLDSAGLEWFNSSSPSVKALEIWAKPSAASVTTN